MNVKCFPLAGTQNYTVEDFQYYLGLRVQGVFYPDDNLKVSPNAPADMSVNVSPGLAWLKAGELRGVSFPLTSGENLAIEPADGLLARVDTVVVGLDITGRVGYLKVVKGILGGTATAPVRDANYYELVLAHISVPAAATEITVSEITDKRADPDVCGLITESGVQIINNLTSTSTTTALSAAMGKALNDAKAPTDSPVFTGALSSPSFVGMLGAFAAGGTPPGWLKCDGSAVSRTTYSALFSFIGTIHGVGDGVTTFNLPKYDDGSFIRGTGGNADAIGVLQADAVISHQHALYSSPESGGGAPKGVNAGTYTGKIWSKSSESGGQLPAGATETRPKNRSAAIWIKY